jgi:hypothetical protein
VGLGGVRQGRVRMGRMDVDNGKEGWKSVLI